MIEVEDNMRDYEWAADLEDLGVPNHEGWLSVSGCPELLALEMYELTNAEKGDAE